MRLACIPLFLMTYVRSSICGVSDQRALAIFRLTSSSGWDLLSIFTSMPRVQCVRRETLFTRFEVGLARRRRGISPSKIDRALHQIQPGGVCDLAPLSGCLACWAGLWMLTFAVDFPWLTIGSMAECWRPSETGDLIAYSNSSPASCACRRTRRRRRCVRRDAESHGFHFGGCAGRASRRVRAAPGPSCRPGAGELRLACSFSARRTRVFVAAFSKPPSYVGGRSEA